MLADAVWSAQRHHMWWGLLCKRVWFGKN